MTIKPPVKRRRVIGSTLAILAILAFFIVNAPKENLKIGDEPLDSLEEGWEVRVGEEIYRDVSLPADFDLAPDEVLRASRIFTENYPEPMTLRIRASMQSLRVSLEGRILYDHEKPEDQGWVQPNASLWHFVSLPLELEGKELAIELASPEKAFSGVINPVHLAGGEALLMDLIDANRIGLLLSALLMILGLAELMVFALTRESGDHRFFHLGMLTLQISLWLLSESRLMQLFTGNRFIIGGISYVLIALMPISFLLFLRDAVLERYQRRMNWIAGVFAINFFLNLWLQLSGTATFFATVTNTSLLILLAAFATYYYLLAEISKDQNQTARKALWTITGFMIFVFIEILVYFSQGFDHISTYSRIGVILFIVLIARNSYRYVKDLILQEQEARIFKNMAYRDILTGGNNRSAFEKALAEVTRQGREKSFRMVIFDINNLKFINDHYGHSAGDSAIIQSHRIILEAFGDIGEVYRIGGDEFAGIFDPVDDKKYLERVKRLRDHLSKNRDLLRYHLDIALGSEVFDSRQYRDFSEFFNHVDRLMYLDKSAIKEAMKDHEEGIFKYAKKKE